MATKPEMLKKHVSDFAKVIELQELSVNMPNRRFRSFKIVVESYCDQAMWNPINWPGGVVVERFFERKRFTTNRFVANVPITHSKSIVGSLECNNESNKQTLNINNKPVGSNGSGIGSSNSNGTQIQNKNSSKGSNQLMKFDSINPNKPNEPIEVVSESSGDIMDVGENVKEVAKSSTSSISVSVNNV